MLIKSTIKDYNCYNKISLVLKISQQDVVKSMMKKCSIFMRLMELWKSVIIPMNDLLNSSLKIIQQIIAYYIKFLHCISEINLARVPARQH
ncbi:uncharacterized protein OCT59_012649 [Rhizophagus irregularis]|uniref:uncharacterized protein n=1 Tax=Rhizophagus irregularis TaxID=588596 RepID=UPI00331D5C97|nr:hypothetical protein OCT59_012649 [Rhizophagus irregularis]